MRFTELGLAEPIVRAVASEGYATPTPIQAKAVPPILAGQDVLGCAQTGTGKTAAFALPLLHRLGGKPARSSGPGGRPPRVLVLCPTRELATQIHESFCAYGRHLPLRHAVIFGGVNQSGQTRQLRAGVDVIVATPGRLLDLMNQRLIDLRAIEALVLDEADRMLDMGFIRDIRRVVERLPERRQTLLFSATMPPEIRRLADSILRDPVWVQTAPVASTVDAVSQSVYLVARKNKPILLERLLRHDAMERTLIFTRTKYGADKLVKLLRRAGLEAEAIHGNKSQNARTRAMQGFKSGKMRVLVATDIASRGIDVDEITHVVNFDMPNVPETYVHRIGRTARAGATGFAYSFCDHEEISDLRAIERLIERSLDVVEHEPDLRLDPSIMLRERDPRQASRGRAGNAGRRAGGSSRRGGNRAQPGRRSRRSRPSAA